MKQQKLFHEKPNREYGGELNKGKRKTQRPLDRKLPLHNVLKATNPNVLLRNVDEINHVCRRMAKKFGLTIYGLGVHADHIHFALRIPHRDLYRRWIRAVTGILARKIAGLKWRHLPYTRIATWGRDFKQLLNYIRANFSEGDFMRGAHERVDDWLRRATG